MNNNTGGGSPVVNPQLYHTTPLRVISQAEQQDRLPKQSELNRLASYFESGAKLLEIVDTINQHADAIVAAGGDRIFFGGRCMDYLEKPQELVDMPGSVRPITVSKAAVARANAVRNTDQIETFPEIEVYPHVKTFPEFPSAITRRTFSFVELLMRTLYQFQATVKEPLPGGFKPINISRYGERRMKRSMRDLSWFLRYITYAIVADDPSILVVNARGLRGVIPEDVTVATVVALKEMCWKALSYFPDDEPAKDMIKYYFYVLIREYEVEKPAPRLREGVSNDQQGLELPQSYWLAAESRPKFVLKTNSSATEKQAVVKAAYRQVFESDIDRTYGITFKQLESQVVNGNISVKEFVRALGKTRLYRRLFYEPYNISRIIELAFRHFLGRGLSSIEEFQDYFAVISRNGLAALIDTLIDSVEYADCFGEETVPYLRGLGQEAQECRNWGAQLNLFKYSAAVRTTPQFVTMFGNYQQPLPNQHVYGVGNDPLETQFGAVFRSETHNVYVQPTAFGQDHHRLLIDSGSSNQNVINNSTKLLKQNQSSKENQQRNINLSNHSIEAIINGVYRQVWGYEPYSGQNLTVAEAKLRNNQISVREFVRQLSKSVWFRDLYWNHLYVTKAIESIHRRLLGRPTYGRSEMNQYYDLCSQKGFYALVDEILDSDEYLETFGEDTVPYERYLTPRGWTMRSSQSTNWSQAQLDRQQTAGEVVAQKIREDRDRKASQRERTIRLASQNNGHATDRPISDTKEIEVKEEVITADNNQTVVPELNSTLPTAEPSDKAKTSLERQTKEQLTTND
ncbi:MAG: phycobilisome rod-core linker polypeptide [Cyanobacteria bacterium P01_G01_bin.19]